MPKSKRKSGFVMAEVVIALSVILIVMVSALSISIHSISAKRKTVNESRANTFAENAWECFKTADSEEEFIDLVEFAEGVTLSDSNNSDNVGSYVYASEERDLQAKVTVDFTLERPTFSIEIQNNKEEIIVSFSYTKGGGNENI